MFFLIFFIPNNRIKRFTFIIIIFLRSIPFVERWKNSLEIQFPPLGIELEPPI